jgi:uncharacterized circularly permuted ATP-grasp superfamily protein
MTVAREGLFENYDPAGFFCEMFGNGSASAGHTREIRERLQRMRMSTLHRRAQATDRELFNLGITFTVYSDKNAIDRVLPFDVIPRVLSREDWQHIESGCIQRVTALNQFIHDIYHRPADASGGSAASPSAWVPRVPASPPRT